MWVSKKRIEQLESDLDEAKREGRYWQGMSMHYKEVMTNYREKYEKSVEKIKHLQNLTKSLLGYIEPPLKKYEVRVFYSKYSNEYFTLQAIEAADVKGAKKKASELLSSLNISGYDRMILLEVHDD